MAARRKITVLCGPNGSARSQRIDQRLHEVGQSARLLVPTVQQARKRREHYFAADGCQGAWGAPVLSLTDFAHDLLAREGVAVTRFESSFQQRQLMEHCLREIAVDLPDTSLVRIRQTPGLIRHLVSVVNDLKQAAVEPEDFRRCLEKVAHPASLDEGVAAVYGLYQECMGDAHLYDVPGLYWHADQCATGGRPRILEGVTTLLWDGFDDFTPSEFRLLHSLSAHVDTILVGLNLDLTPDRQDRYTLTLKTLNQFKEYFDCQVVECEASDPESHIDFAARHIFWREEPSLSDNVENNLTILPCSDTIHEVETIARRTKRLVVEEEVPPHEIAVVYRNISRVSGALQSAFTGMGVPCQVNTTKTLDETSLGRTLLNLISGADGWARESVLDLLFSPWLQGVLGEGIPMASDYYARKAGILDGYKNWEFRLGRLTRQLERGESRDAQSILLRLPDALTEVSALLDAVGRLRELQERLPAKATQYDFAVELDAVLKGLKADEEPSERRTAVPAAKTGGAPVLPSLGMPGTVFVDPPSEGGNEYVHSELEALRAVHTLLELLADGPGSDMVPMKREEFLVLLGQGMKETAVQERGTPGGVLCMDAAQVRNQRYEYVFFGGLTEGQVPSPPSGNAVYPEPDRDRLQAAGIPIESNEAHHARERMLFGHVLECAAKALTLSWPLTQDDGRETSRSPFLTDVVELFPDLAGVMEPYPKADSFLPPLSGLSGERDLLNRAFFDCPPLATAFPACGGDILDRVSVERERQAPGDFGIQDGALQDTALVEAIAREYGSSHEFSVNQLEAYLGCPFSFYVQRILRLEESEAPDGTVEARERGTLLHEVLQRFHREFAGLHVRDIGLEKAEETMTLLANQVFEDYDWSRSSAPKGAIEGEKFNLLSRLINYLRLENAKAEEQHWKPQYVEVAFGRGAQVESGSPATDDAFTLETGVGPVQFTGRIDRIDMADSDARIIDYKTGGLPATGDITSGKSLQLSVYAKAIEEAMMPGSPCAEAQFITVGKEKVQDGLGKGKNGHGWPNRQTNMMKAIEAAVEGIRRGYFPPVRGGKDCFGCGNAHACRYDEARMARKTAVNEEAEE